MELLAPAGNFEALRAAVEAGANAVYLAGPNFGARAYANNFTREELTEAVRFAHLRNVAIHVTVNTIVADSELPALADYLRFLEQARVDAILIQDLGVAAVAKRVAPKLTLHASTQMTVHSLEGVNFLESLGFSRVVLSRELTLPEIKHICSNTKLEIEVFMHGALCVCYSGQCLMSSMIGARSGNRGRCAQPCRLPYELVNSEGENLLGDNAGKFLLSPKDLNTLDLLPQLIDAGVSSLKIEGRMKRPEYVAIVVETYRNAIEGHRLEDSNRRLAQIFNRDFTTAYLEDEPGRQMISDMRPNNRGVLIGRVAAVSSDSLSIKISQSQKLNRGDQIEVWTKVGGRATFTVEKFSFSGGICRICRICSLNGSFSFNSNIRPHDRVFKVFDAELTEHARKFFTSSSPIRRICVDFEVTARLGKAIHIKVTDSDGNVVEVDGSIEATAAVGKALDRDLLCRQLSRLGNTIYEFRFLKVDIDLEVGIMVPISEINQLRRQAVTLLDNLRLLTFLKESYKELPLSCKKVRKEQRSGNGRGGFVNSATDDHSHCLTALVVAVDSIAALGVALDAGADAILFGGESYHHKAIASQDYLKAIDLAHDRARRLFVATPRIVR